MKWLRGGLVALSASALLAPAAAANTYVVGTTNDASATPCATPPCSLRQVILKAEASPFPPDTIHVPPGTYSLDPALGALVVDHSMTIVGAGAASTTIAEPVPADRNAPGAKRVFEIVAPSGGATPVVSITGVTITGGTANSSGGFNGGDVNNQGTLTLSDDAITNGFACSGGGVANSGTLTVLRTVVSGNHAACAPGGDDSGGIVNLGAPGAPDLPAYLVLEDSTVAGNDARLVGGVFSWNDPSNTVAIRNSTIADNVAKDEASGAARGPGGGLGVGDGIAVVQNSIIAGNLEIAGGVTTLTNCMATGGAISSLGHNIDSGADCKFGSAGDLQNTDPMLSGLSANGGPTETLALLPGSRAINGGDPNGCTSADGSPLLTDQRGVARPQGSACDIGAFEFQVPALSGAPSVGGTPKVGQSLTCQLPTISSPDQAPATTVAWLRDGQQIATGNSYTVKPSDAGHSFACSTTVTDAAGSAAASSVPVAVAAPKPTVKITHRRIGKTSATFSFKVTFATSVRCAVAVHHKFRRFKPCKSPVTYRLRGVDGFQVRVSGPGGAAATGFASARTHAH